MLLEVIPESLQSSQANAARDLISYSLWMVWGRRSLTVRRCVDVRLCTRVQKRSSAFFTASAALLLLPCFCSGVADAYLQNLSSGSFQRTILAASANHPSVLLSSL